MRLHSFKVLALAMSLMVFTNLSAQDCSCVDCPIDIFNLQTHTSTIDVQVGGPNDLGSCGINEVCFTIAHTWVGDLSVSLVSPSGLKYLVMADAENMPPNGCGNSENNLNVCIRTGTDNPITNNTEYVCNGSTGFCMEGAYTVPCGGVTDPFDGALQAPNCDLNDFNIPGHPANGQWTLIVNDICDLNVGQLIDWSISFDCGTSSCTGCDADGGDLTFPDFEACAGAPELDLSLSPVYNGSAPDPNLFDYTYLIIDGGIITGVSDDPDLQNMSSGIYSVCGISFEAGQIALIEALIGTDYASIGSNLGMCYDLSLSCLGVEIVDPADPFTEHVELCFGQCYTALDGVDYCSTGTFIINYVSNGGCSSSMTLDLNILPEYNSSESFLVCLGDEIEYNGQFFSAGNYNIILSSGTGCDSLVSLEVNEVSALATILPEGINLDCGIDELSLYSTGSVYESIAWYDSNWNLLGTEDSVVVSSQGSYNLEVSVQASNTACFDTAFVVINDVGEVPIDPIFSAGETSFCLNEQYTFCVDPDINVTDYLWQIPTGFSVISNPSENCIELSFDQALQDEICVIGENLCGQSNATCIPIVVHEAPSLVSQVETCDLATETFDLEIVLDGDAISIASSSIVNYTFSGNTFSASNLSGGLDYAITFTSENCGSLLVSGNNDCVCDNIAPSLDYSSATTCIGEPIVFENNGPSDDIQYATIFVLHTDPTNVLGTQLMISTDPYFEYDANIIPSQVPLYVTGLRGQALPVNVDPFIDLQDPCLRYSNQLVFQYEDPEPLVAYISDICLGDPVQLIVQATGGPFTVYINGHSYDFTGSGMVLLLPQQQNQYIFESYEDGNGCSVQVDTVLDFEIYQPGNIELIAPSVELCNSDWEGGVTTTDLNDFLNIEANGTWTDLASTGALTGTVFDAEGLVPGVYSFEFSSDPIGSCPSEVLEFDVEVIACFCPQLNEHQLVFCNDLNGYDLLELIPDGLEGGIWSVENTGSGVSVPSIEFGVLVFDSDVVGSYNLYYDYTALGFLGCPGIDTIALDFIAAAIVDINQDRMDLCISDLPLDLGQYEPLNLNGNWSYNGSQDLVLDNSLIESAAEGEYVLYFTQEFDQVCDPGFDSLIVNIFGLPQRLNPEDKQVDIHCFENFIQIGSAELCSQSQYEFLWHTISGADISDIYACQPLVTGSGVFELIVYDIDSGCEVIDTVIVSEADDAPEFDIQVDPITCFGDEDGMLELKSLNVAHSPYNIFLNGDIIDSDEPITGLQAGDYELLLVDGEGCTVSKVIQLIEPVEMELSLAPFDPVVQVGDFIQLEALSNYTDVVYNWSTASGDYNDFGSIIELPVFFNQTVYLEGINKAGCVRSLEVNLEALDKFKVYVPNIFSPNNDGFNDRVTVFSGSDINLVRSFKIFSRWGGLMFENYDFLPNDLGLGWDGFVNDKKAAEGDYVWYAEIEIDNGSSRLFKGDIVLIR